MRRHKILCAVLIALVVAWLFRQRLSAWVSGRASVKAAAANYMTYNTSLYTPSAWAPGLGFCRADSTLNVQAENVKPGMPAANAGTQG